MGAKRRFELVEGTSSKFWEIEVSDSSHTVTFGRIGTKGQSKTKELSSSSAAAADAAKLVKEKTGKGYREVGAAVQPAIESANAPPSPPPPPPAAKSAPGTKTTLKGPRGKPAFVILASGTSVTANGERRDFASAVEAKRHVDQLVRAKLGEGYKLGAAEIVGDEPEPESEVPSHEEDDTPQVEEPAVEVRDQNGRFRITFEGERTDEAACTALATRIASEQPTSVHVFCELTSPGDAWATAFARARLPSVTAFIFDTAYETQTRQGENSIGDVRQTLDALPSLERLFATGDLAISKGTHAALRELFLLGDPLDGKFLRGLATWKLPALERLVLSLASDASPADEDAALAAIVDLDAPKLSRVYVEAVDDVPRFLERIVASGRLAGWSELHLVGSVRDDDRLLAVVTAHVEMLRELRVLGLPLDDVSSETEESLRGLCPSLVDASESDATLPDAYDSWR